MCSKLCLLWLNFPVDSRLHSPHVVENDSILSDFSLRVYYERPRSFKRFHLKLRSYVWYIKREQSSFVHVKNYS